MPDFIGFVPHWRLAGLRHFVAEGHWVLSAWQNGLGSQDEGGEESVYRFDAHRSATLQVLRRMLWATVSINQLSISKRLILEV
jgi:hypothetical protein